MTDLGFLGVMTSIIALIAVGTYPIGSAVGKSLGAAIGEVLGVLATRRRK